MNVVEIFGLNLTDGLDTEPKRQAAIGIYQMIEEVAGADAAREWMITANPTFNGAVPIRLLVWGCIEEVAVAAHALVKKSA